MARPRSIGVIGARWPAALRAELRANLVGDVGLQVLVAALWFWHLRSPWLVTIWVIRWCVVAAVVLAFRPLAERRRERAIGVAVAGHLFGVVTTVAVVPEVIPLAIFVLVGDLLALVRYGWPRRRAVAVVATTGAVASLLTLQHWTGLAARAPRGMFIAFIVGHSVGTGWFHASASSRSRRQLLEFNAALADIGPRVQRARITERRRFAAALAAGPIAELADLRTAVSALADGGRAPAPGAVDAAVRRAQQVSASLRELAHGVYPDGLRQHGLATALRSLQQRTGVACTVDLGRSAPAAEVSTAIYFVAASLVARDAPPAALGVALEQGAHHCTARLRLSGGSAGGARFDDVDAAVGGRIHAANADARVDATADGLALSIVFPSGGTVGADPQGPTAAAPDPGRARSLAQRAVALTAAGLPLALVVGSRTAWVLALCALGVALAGRAFVALRQRRPYLAMAAAAVGAYGGAAVATAVAPEVLPIAALVVMTPLLVGLDVLPARAVAVLTVLQSGLGGLIALLGLLRSPADRVSSFPTAVAATLLPLATVVVLAGIGYVVSVTHGRLVADADELRASYTRLAEVSDEERRTIERDLHDGGQQQAVAIALQLRALARSLDRPDRAEALRADVDRAIEAAAGELRALAVGSSPVDRGSTLAEALRASLRTGAVPVEVIDAVDADLADDVVQAAYFCCVEGVQNALKHASAGHITVALTTLDGVLTLEVTDDGAGFDPRLAAPGVGLGALRQRLADAGGELEVRTARGAGTTLVCRLPLRTAAAVSASPGRGTAARP